MLGRVRSAIFAACLICGCGRIDFAPLAGDASVGSGGGVGGGDPGDAGGVPSDVAPAGACGGVVLLADDFEDGAIAPVWTELTGTNLTVAETAGFLQITYGSNVPASQAAGYITTSNLDFTGTCVDVELAMAPNPATLASAEVRIGTPTDCSVFDVTNGQLTGAQHRGASISRMPAIPYDPVAQRHLRLREAAGVWYFEISPDGSAYTTIYTVMNSFPSQTSTTLRLVASSASAVNSGGAVQFAGIRMVKP